LCISDSGEESISLARMTSVVVVNDLAIDKLEWSKELMNFHFTAIVRHSTQVHQEGSAIAHTSASAVGIIAHVVVAVEVVSIVVEISGRWAIVIATEEASSSTASSVVAVIVAKIISSSKSAS
jgi:hypothetical protein